MPDETSPPFPPPVRCPCVLTRLVVLCAYSCKTGQVPTDRPLRVHEAAALGDHEISAACVLRAISSVSRRRRCTLQPMVQMA